MFQNSMCKAKKGTKMLQELYGGDIEKWPSRVWYTKTLKQVKFFITFFFLNIGIFFFSFFFF